MEIQFVEFLSYSSRRSRRVTDEEHLELERTLRKDPLRGRLVRGTGGVRKVRLRKTGRGKSGGFRVIYYFVSRTRRIHLLDIYAKGEKDNLTGAQKNQLKQILSELG